jgi:hypothetical protein
MSGQPAPSKRSSTRARDALGGIDILVNNATGYGFSDQPEACARASTST